MTKISKYIEFDIMHFNTNAIYCVFVRISKEKDTISAPGVFRPVPHTKKRRRVVFSQRSVPSACWGIKVFTNRYGTFFCDNELPDSKIQAALTWLTA